MKRPVHGGQPVYSADETIRDAPLADAVLHTSRAIVPSAALPRPSANPLLLRVREIRTEYVYEYAVPARESPDTVPQLLLETPERRRVDPGQVDPDSLDSTRPVDLPATTARTSLPWHVVAMSAFLAITSLLCWVSVHRVRMAKQRPNAASSTFSNPAPVNPPAAVEGEGNGSTSPLPAWAAAAPCSQDGAAAIRGAETNERAVGRSTVNQSAHKKRRAPLPVRRPETAAPTTARASGRSEAASESAHVSETKEGDAKTGKSVEERATDELGASLQ